MRRSIGRGMSVIAGLGLLIASPGCGDGRRADAEGAAPSAVAATDGSVAGDALVRALRVELGAPPSRERDLRLRDGWVRLLDSGREAEARALYLEAVGKDPQLALVGFGVLASYFATNAAWQGLADWTGELATHAAMPVEWRAHSHVLEARAFAELGQYDRLADRVPAVMHAFDPPLARRVLFNFREVLLAAEASEALEALLTAVETAADGMPDASPSWRGYRAQTMLMVALRAGDLDAASGALERLATVGPPVDAADGFARLTEALLTADRAADAEALSQRYACAPETPEPLRVAAARHWLAAARREDDAAAQVDRLETLFATPLDARARLTLLQGHFYEVLSREHRDWTARLLSLARELEPHLDEPFDQGTLRLLIFDAAFMHEAYDEALGILEQGIAGRDEDWHTMADNKTRAHRALVQEDWAVAATRFRQFMGDLERQPRMHAVDPSTGLRHTLEMTLGFNARRVGELWQRLGDEAQAREAFGEARAYYEQALSETAENSREWEYLQHEMAQLPE